jgi:phosphoribosylaminoimidazolecarboxamide formyltransferase/IMP cyclohydrolase
MSGLRSRAVISVFDKTGAAELARFLEGREVEIVSSGGTARHLEEAGVTVTPVERISGFPELLDGRVKTLHPAVHAGILARREREDDMVAIREHGILPVDWVAVNLYPFRRALEEGLRGAALREYIDIGGPTLLRAAAKNYTGVVVICDPEDYPGVIEECRTEGEVSESTRRSLAEKVFALTAGYDRLVAEHLTGKPETREESAGPGGG